MLGNRSTTESHSKLDFFFNSSHAWQDSISKGIERRLKGAKLSGCGTSRNGRANLEGEGRARLATVSQVTEERGSQEEL